jgi:phosphoribosylformimino-5-aminoimidazole carboxamide ribotide isomerase
MLIIPAIDLKEGKVVRLVQGKFNKKVYSSDPVQTAKHWARQGAKLIHIVDLDGAMEGKFANLDIVKRIIKEAKVRVQYGGGVRSEAIVKKLFESGVSRVVIGTKAVEDSRFLINIFKKFRDNIIVSIDEIEGSVFTRGWRIRVKAHKTLEFAKKLKEMGFKRIIYTDIKKDGTLKGPNIQNIKRILKETGLEVIASGGVSSLEDIRKLKILERSGLAGVIVGKALYEGKFTLRAALDIS